MRRIYKKNVIQGLEDLSSRGFQEVAWFKNNQGLSSSFGDDVNAVFDDTALGDMLENEETVFGKAADDALRDLDESTNAIDEFTMSDEEILNAPEMDIVRQKAALALELVKASDGSESTVEIVE